MGVVIILLFLVSSLVTKSTADDQEPFLQCSVRFRLHPSFIDYFTRQSNFNETLTKRQMINTSFELLNEVNRVFNVITFGTTTKRRVRFELTSLVSMTDRNCSPGTDDANTYLCNPKSVCQPFLNEYIQEIENQHCLDLLLINWPESGLNGCSFVANADFEKGVCANGTAYVGPFNVGLVNLFDRQGISTKSRATVLSLTKTIGRLFGARDDPISIRCQPGQPNGNFIMSKQQAPASEQPKNWLTFSPCSIEDMSAVLDEMRQGKRRDCLKTVMVSIPTTIASASPISNIQTSPAAASSTKETPVISPALNNSINDIHLDKMIVVVGVNVIFIFFLLVSLCACCIGVGFFYYSKFSRLI